MGTVKKVNDYEVYVKSKHCFGSLSDLIKYVKSDDNFDPWVKQILGEWRFLQNDLIPLLIFHKKDKLTAFQVCKLMVLLTCFPKTSEAVETSREKKKFTWTNVKSKYRHLMVEILRGYKEAFLQP